MKAETKNKNPKRKRKICGLQHDSLSNTCHARNATRSRSYTTSQLGKHEAQKLLKTERKILKIKTVYWK